MRRLVLEESEEAIQEVDDSGNDRYANDVRHQLIEYAETCTEDEQRPRLHKSDRSREDVKPECRCEG